MPYEAISAASSAGAAGGTPGCDAATGEDVIGAADLADESMVTSAMSASMSDISCATRNKSAITIAAPTAIAMVPARPVMIPTPATAAATK